MPCGGIVLCGGKSRRMQADKASLPFGSEIMLARVTRLMGEAVHPVVTVAAPDQVLPALTVPRIALRDEHPNGGPLAGIYAGLKHLASRGCTAAAVCACDAPLLKPDIIRRLADLLEDRDAVVPVLDQPQPLLAVYSARLLPTIARLLDQKLEDSVSPPGPIALLQACRARLVPADQLRELDPDLDSFLNVNTQEEYHEALRKAEK